MITNLSGMGVSVPNGFATTADAFNQFLDQSGVNQRIYELLDKTDIDDVTELAKAGAQIRQWIIDTPFQPELENAVRDAYAQLSADDAHASFAVRSSATAEDMPDASFAGQQETFLNVQGFDAVLVAIKHVFASLFNDRAISYRVHQGYDHRGVALSAGVQRMVRSDLASSGVMFSIDTESGFDQVVFITSAWAWARWLCRVPLTRMNSTCTNRLWRQTVQRSSVAQWVRKNPHGLRANPGTRQAGDD